MKIEEFTLERQQSIWEGKVKYNLSESGVHPGSIKSLFDLEMIDIIENTELTYGYTEGSPELRSAISKIYNGSKPDNIQVYNGSSEANFVALMTLIEPNDEVICVLPNYMQIHGLAKALGANIKIINTNESTNWKISIQELEQNITDKTKLITICNPNNPTGSILDKQSINEIGAVAEKVGAWILADEVYRGSELDGQECESFWNLSYDRKIINCGLSKAYGLPGLRVGWTVSNEKFIKNCWANHDYTSIAIGRLSDVIASHVLRKENRSVILNKTRSSLNKNLSIFKDWAQQFNDKFKYIEPQAGAMIFVNYDWNINSTKLVDRIRNEVSVLLVAGDWYGYDHYLRFGYGAKEKDLISALEIISPALKRL